MKMMNCFKMFFVWAAVVALILTGFPVTVMAVNSTVSANDPPEGISLGEWQKMQAQIRKTRYHFTAEDAGTYAANNRQRGFTAKFDKEAVEIMPESSEAVPAWSFRLSVSGYGYGNEQKSVRDAGIAADKNRLEYRRGDLTEWYVNDENGMEQGFTVAKPPVKKNGEPLRIEMTMDTGLSPELSQNGQVVNFRDASGQTVLIYHKLAVSDADNQKIPAHFEVAGNVLSISVDDRNAKYPLTVDPLITLITTEQKISLCDASTKDNIGYSVSVSGDVMVAGAPFDDSNGTDSGRAYVFYRNQGGADNWGLVKKLDASNTVAGDKFGYSVSVSGDIIAVGVPYHDRGGTDSGSVYIFSRNQGGLDNWGLVISYYGDIGDVLGWSVSVSGDIIVAGAIGKDDNGSASGLAYVLSKNQGGTNNWGRVKILNASDGAAGDLFGYSVSVSGDIIVVGAIGDDDGGDNSGSAYIFSRNQGGADNWGQMKKITAYNAAAGDTFGYSVSVSGDIIVVGAPYNDKGGTNAGSVYLFSRNKGDQNNWGLVQSYPASIAGFYFGWSVSVSGDIMVAGAPFYKNTSFSQSYAFVYSRNKGGADKWGGVKTIYASDSTLNNAFGNSVSVSGDTIAVGAMYDDDGGDDSGASYVFSRNQGGADNWGQVRKVITSTAAAGDWFGYSVSASEDTIVIGAKYGYISSGSAYVFNKDEERAKEIIASDAAATDNFGGSVSVSGDIIVVGATGDDDRGDSSGSAYIFSRNKDGANNWGELKKLTASDGAAGDSFGGSVSVSGDIIVVGVNRRDDVGTDSGAVYIFSKNQGGTDNWGQLQKLTASDAAAGSHFGRSVSVSGNIIIVGAMNAAYVFRNQGGTWVQLKKLTDSDSAGDNFGWSVSVSGDIIAVGAISDKDEGKSSAVYVFSKDKDGTDNWGFVKRLAASDTDDKYFGVSVSVSGDFIVAGAQGTIFGHINSGAAYVFYKNQGGSNNWGLTARRTAKDAVLGDNFGFAVSVSGNTLVVGANQKDSCSIKDSGAAYIYDLNLAPYVVSIIPKNYRNLSSSEDFTVTFSEDVSGVDASDFTLPPTGTTGTALGTISSVSGSGSVYTVTISEISGTGTLKLGLTDDDSIQDEKDVPLGGTGTGNGNFTDGENLSVVPVADVESVKRKKAILVAGGGESGYSGAYLWKSTIACTDQAKTALLFQGYDPSNIRYLAAGSSDDTTSANLQDAITTWAAKETSGGYSVNELLIYMTGHGTPGQFTLKGNPNTTLSAAVLKSWLNTLQDTTKMRVILIYDACYSGSFITGAAKDAGKTYERIIITSAEEDEIAVFGDNGKLSFSMPFWNAVMIRGLLLDAFISTKSGIKKMELTQNPQITGMPSDDLKIGLGAQQSASSINIGAITPERCAQPPAVSVHNISSIVGIDSVKADIQYYLDPNAIIDDPVKGVPLFSDPASEATDDHVYRLSLEGYLTKTGTYHVCVYATDMNNHDSERICTIITNPSCGNLNGDTFLDLADVIIALRVSAGINVSLSLSGDVNGDAKIGMEEAIYILQSVAGLR